MRLKQNNCGITLIELVISMAIAAIILSMIAIMINTAARGFKRTNEDVNLQMEAQITINQLSTLLMEAKSITGPNPGAGPLDLKYLLEGNPLCYSIYFAADQNRLYLISADTVSDANIINPIASQTLEYQYLLAEYVNSITIDNTDTKTAELEIVFELGDQTYTANKKVKLRNKK